MASIIRFRRGTTTEHQTFIGLLGEITIDITKKTVVAHDGVTPGGSPLLTETVFNSFSANVYNKTEVDQLIANVSMDMGNITLAQVAITGNYEDLNNKPVYSNVATTGSYDDLIGTPILHPVAISGAYGDLNGKPILANVAITGDYNDLINKPTFDGNTYVTQAQLDLELQDYATVSSLNNYVTNANLLVDGTAAGLASQIYVNQQDTLISGLIAGKADINHTHIIANVVGLQSELDNKANVSDLSNYVTNSALTTTLVPYVQTVTPPPTFEEGQAGDKKGMMAFDNNFLYICVADWEAPGTNIIWRRVSWYDTIIGS